MPLRLLREYDNERIYHLDTETIIITLDENDCKIEISDSEGAFGEINLIESDDGESHHIALLDFSRHKRKGIGTEALVFFKEYFGTKLTATPNDGHEREDGSHLTGDGLPFVTKLQRLGIVEPFYDNDNEDPNNPRG